ncbi:VanZ family protein [Leifsonia xyli]|uniref:VanZ family protein n=1 Tax=Leifsonia xyli TaxID=1575 RepID=UPI003D6728B2
MSTAIPAAPHRPRDHRILLRSLFAVYLGLLTWAVLWKLGMPSLHGGTRAVKLVPFVAGDGYGVNSMPEMLANVALFVPFGVCLGLIAPHARWWRAAAAAAAVSVGFEALQFALAVGSSDVTDVILNTTGAVLGWAVLGVARGGLRERTAPVLARVCTVATVLALAAGAVALARPVHYGPPPGELTHVRPPGGEELTPG